MVNGFFGGGKKWRDLLSPEDTNNPAKNEERIDVDVLCDMCILLGE